MIPVWPKVKLKSLYHGLYDGPHATPKESEDGAVFLGIKNVTGDGRLDLSEIRHIAEEDLAKWTKRVKPSKNDIVFSYEATLHRYARIPVGFRGCLGRRMALIRPDKSKVDINYLFSYFLSPFWRAEVEKHILSGATVDRIPLTNVPEFELFLPPLQIQKNISAILSSYDDLIENNLKRIKFLEEMAQITFEEWFVRMKLPGHETVVFDEETGIPESWVQTSLSEAIHINPTTKVSTKESAPYVPMGALSTSSMIIEGIESRIPSGGAKFKNGDTLVARITPCLENGKTGFVDFLLNDQVATGSTEFIVLRESSEVNRYFIYCLARSDYFRGFSINNMLGSDGRQRVNHKAYDKYLINVPPRNIMEEFEQLASPAFSTIKYLVRQNNLLREAKDILLPRLMTGVIDIEQVELPEAMLKRLEEQEDKIATAV